MVKLNKIYTKTGDNGTTALVNGPRRSKADLRVEAYGLVDSLNAVIGIVRLHSVAHALIDCFLADIQNDLFDLGADLATPVDGTDYETLRIVARQVQRLEDEIDQLNEHLQPLQSFILPGGSALSAYLHLARVHARDAERAMVRLSEIETVGVQALCYINRLSDYFFVAARIANHNGADDILWVAGKNRS